mmetsp:Transcript_10547/g.23251  ORF Transcript_10547/g.23251 Transcript_10547/m.23251 type:complete len:247 (+) Transcript_10547:36-776(+)|eukprot:CAMPEP_0204371360 /NCGR_PEP_ID=MMETSP0469-20131031/46442_1 /ASSEMBLY_ACC=CAM_ASM_000384 /TAXON_ID=2969 /ORGANISM="Oxyrrhis marina" /LENGTH=246 /DNA_ID=CAMNT_0051361461 /DNA_START=21 /DNA_END=761 /DNA_ORIENTATION=+
MRISWVAVLAASAKEAFEVPKECNKAEGGDPASDDCMKAMMAVDASKFETEDDDPASHYMPDLSDVSDDDWTEEDDNAVPPAEDTESDTRDQHYKRKHPKSGGWNDKIEWRSLDEMKEIAASGLKKPVMVLIHHHGCIACESLMAFVADSPEIEKLSSKFVMINHPGEPERQRWGEKFLDRGRAYAPRVFFLTHAGSKLPVYGSLGEDHEKYRYFYNDDKTLHASMVQALAEYGIHSDFTGIKDEF